MRASLLLAVCLVAGCGASADPAPSGPACEPGNDPCIGRVAATFHDDGGAPIASLNARFCSDDICFAGTTDATGALSLDVGRRMPHPVLTVAGARDFPTLARATTGSGDLSLGTVVLPRLPSPASLVPGQTISSGLLALVIPASAAIDGVSFAAVQVPLEGVAALVDPALGFDAVIAVSPSGTAVDPPAGLRVENVAGYPAGVPVDVYANGTLPLASWAPDGRWAKIATARVSDDAGTIACDACLPVLAPLALRRSP